MELSIPVLMTKVCLGKRPTTGISCLVAHTKDAFEKLWSSKYSTANTDSV